MGFDVFESGLQCLAPDRARSALAEDALTLQFESFALAGAGRLSSSFFRIEFASLRGLGRALQLALLFDGFAFPAARHPLSVQETAPRLRVEQPAARSRKLRRLRTQGGELAHPYWMVREVSDAGVADSVVWD